MAFATRGQGSIALSHHDYRALCQESAENEQKSSGSDAFDITWKYPSLLGQGFVREISLRDGLELAIADYQAHEDIQVTFPDREHPLEYMFCFSEAPSPSSVPYYLYGSGISPKENWQLFGQKRFTWMNVHIEPDVFQSFVGNASEGVPSVFQHLIGDVNQEYYARSGQSTPAMQVVIQQILRCPYQEFTKRMFLESKAWELMAMLLEQEREARQGKSSIPKLKPDDVDRLHHAKAILLQNLDQPPSLMQLALRVGLNECTLKRGFREVFHTTVFGCLRHYRMEQARVLLLEGRMNVHEAAQAVGYKSQSRFATVFRQTFGVNPKAFSAQSRH